MNTDQILEDDTVKQDDAPKPYSAKDLIDPTDGIEKTSPEREDKIRNFQEKLGLSRDLAERMVDETGG